MNTGLQEGLSSPLLTTEEACQYLRIGRSTLYALIKDGQIAQIHPVPGRSAFLKVDLDQFILSKRQS
jgi:excisionase family DNA binding protein